MKKHTFYICLTLLLFTAAVADAQQVRVIYFQPLDVPKPAEETLQDVRNILRDVQEFYKNEMEKHGYGNKTFSIESDANSNPVIHVVPGKRNLKAYTDNTAIQRELPADLKDNFAAENRIRVIFLGGSERIGSGAVTYIKCKGKTCAYDALVPADNGVKLPQFTAHELGHTFGLQHHPTLGKDKFVMETLFFSNKVPKLGDSQIDDFEARWLDKHKYFNKRESVNNPPGILKIHEPTASMIDGKQHIEWVMDLESNIALHQAQISKGNSGLLLGWKALQNRAETTRFAVRRNDLLGVKSLNFQVMDTQGNMNRHILPITLPAKTITLPAKAEKLEDGDALEEVPWGELKQ